MKQVMSIAALCGAVINIWPIYASGEEVTPMDPSTKRGCENKEQMAPYPKTTKELVTNLKLALESGEMEKQEFYTEDNLKQISGAAKVEIRPQGGDDIIVDLSELKSNSKFSGAPLNFYINKTPYVTREFIEKIIITTSIIKIHLNPVKDQTSFYPELADLFACG